VVDGGGSGSITGEFTNGTWTFATAAAVADGTVLREVRRGFYHDDGLLRLAEVIVSKKANP